MKVLCTDGFRIKLEDIPTSFLDYSNISKDKNQTSTFRLLGLTHFYGKHYVTIVFNKNKSPLWRRFDDCVEVSEELSSDNLVTPTLLIYIKEN